MKIPYLKAVSVAVVALVLLSCVPIGRTQGETQDYVSSFLLLNRPDGDLTYQLNVSIPYSLYQYYTADNHFLFSPQDFPKFVTPYTLKPIADRLWQIYNNTEDYTNGVLMLVHQITYQEVAPGKYPVETLVNGYGDCDLFSYIAASILEAGGIPTVLLYYKDQEHMEIAVDLGQAPTDARTPAFGFTVNNATYYIAESTGGKWRQGWRVGECPTDYQNATSQVVTLQNMEQSSIGQVSANLRELDPSTLALQVSSSFMLEDSPLVISGQILPETPNQNVTLQAQTNSGGWTTIATIETQQDGRFSYSWQPTTGGSVEIQASWEGNTQLNGATSTQNNVLIVPLYFILLILAAVLLGAVVVLLFVVSKRRKQQTSPTLAQQPSSLRTSPQVP